MGNEKTYKNLAVISQESVTIRINRCYITGKNWPLRQTAGSWRFPMAALRER